MEQSLDLNNELELFQSRLKQREDKIGHWLTEGTKQTAESQCAKHAELMRKRAGKFAVLLFFISRVLTKIFKMGVPRTFFKKLGVSLYNFIKFS